MAKETLEQMRETAERLYLDETNIYLNSLKAESTYQIISQFPTINKQPCHIKLNDDGEMEMRVTEMKSTPENPPASYQHAGYGFHHRFWLARPESGFNVRFGVGSLNISFGGADTFKGKFYELESAIGKQSAYFRCVLPVGQGEPPSTYLESKPFVIGQSLRGAGLVKIKIADCEIKIFDYRLDDKKTYLFIDAVVPCSYEIFKKVIDIFLIHYGWISGCLIRKRMIILIATDPGITNIKHFSYYKLDESKKGLEAVRPRDIVDFIKTEDLLERYLNSKVLSNLIEYSLENSAFLRAATIISESHGYPLEIKASTYSVALETLKNIIIEKNQDKINPIKIKTVARDIVKILKETVNNHLQESDFNNRDLYLQRIEQLNQIGNTDSFMKAFELMGLYLNDKDRDCLTKRNDFLHGRIPFEEQPGQPINTELATVVMRLHLLLCALMLKMTGYSGFLFNNMRYRFPELENEPIYRNLSYIDRDLYVNQSQ
ncbi:MAG: hypothetical protein EOP47_11955 [Sphingobacteriaceae bacterium]|nr:MAG: hypothetical protein EOP47_11955 [Sphingobacteriaceae bacterium]